MSDNEHEITFTKNTGYSDSHNNYVLPKEITVTITLNEYRKLVEENSKADYKLNALREEKNNEINKLKEEIERLKKKFFDDDDDE
jgi:hypothetical protein